MKKLFVIISLVCLSACNSKKLHNEKCNTEEKNSIDKVTLAYSGFGCESACPFQAVSVDDKLTLNYFGGTDAKIKGYYTGKVSKEMWDSIQARFEKFIVSGIDTTKFEESDHPNIELFIQDSIRNLNTRFQENTGKITNEDEAILYWLITIPHRINLKATDSLHFETTLQYQPLPKTSAVVKMMDTLN